MGAACSLPGKKPDKQPVDTKSLTTENEPGLTLTPDQWYTIMSWDLGLHSSQGENLLTSRLLAHMSQETNYFDGLGKSVSSEALAMVQPVCYKNCSSD